MNSRTRNLILMAQKTLARETATSIAVDCMMQDDITPEDSTQEENANPPQFMEEIATLQSIQEVFSHNILCEMTGEILQVQPNVFPNFGENTVHTTGSENVVLCETSGDFIRINESSMNITIPFVSDSPSDSYRQKRKKSEKKSSG